MGGVKTKRPAGWYSKQARAERAAELREKRRARAEGKAEQDRFRAALDRKPAMIRAGALRRIELARKALAENPGIDRYAVRLARLEAARKREQQRLDHLVLGHPRPQAKVTVSKVRSKRKRTVSVPVALDPEIERAVAMQERWAGSAGAPETEEAASRNHDGHIAQLWRNHTLTVDQMEWAEQIAGVYASIEADVVVKVSSYKARVDEPGGRGAAIEGVKRVRMQIAYQAWRKALPAGKHREAVLDMLTRAGVGYTVAAARHRVHNRVAKRWLIAAIDAWPEFVDQAYRDWTDDAIREARDRADAA